MGAFGGRVPGSRAFRGRNSARFDGNGTDDIPPLGNWLFGAEDLADRVDEALDVLMEYVVEGNLRWFLVPPAGFRL